MLCHLGNWLSEEHVGNALADIAILTHDIAQRVANVCVGIGLVMHGEAQVHGMIKVGGSLNLAQCRAFDGVDVVHVSTIHGLGCCAYFVCHLANWSGS